MFFVNGLRQDSVPAADRGLNYGDGVFETVAVRDRRCLLWDAHLARLYDGLRRLRFARVPERQLLAEEAGALAEECGHGVVKIVVTRGSGRRGLGVSGAERPTRVVSAYPWDESVSRRREAGVAVRFCALRLAAEPEALRGVKHLNRLPQVLARLEWPADVDEGLLADDQDRLIEGAASNVFLVVDGALVTPRLDRCGLAGTMRAQVLERALALGIRSEIRDVPLREALTARELFLTNGVVGIWPVRSLDGAELPVGRLTRTLQSALNELEPPVLA
jgi:4-amino-4-deoxychorismate lyase